MKDRHYLRVKEWKSISNKPKQQAIVAILVSDKTDFKLNLIKQVGKDIIHSPKGKIHQQVQEF